jgi:hypothetical protein
MNDNMGSIITLLILGGFSVIESVLSFMEKGIPLNNYYLFASEYEKQRLDMKHIYRQTAIVFALVGAMFLILAFLILFNRIELITPIVLPLCIITLVYAIVSSL